MFLYLSLLLRLRHFPTPWTGHRLSNNIQNLSINTLSRSVREVSELTRHYGDGLHFLLPKKKTIVLVLGIRVGRCTTIWRTRYDFFWVRGPTLRFDLTDLTSPRVGVKIEPEEKEGEKGKEEWYRLIRSLGSFRRRFDSLGKRGKVTERRSMGWMISGGTTQQIKEKPGGKVRSMDVVVSTEFVGPSTVSGQVFVSFWRVTNVVLKNSQTASLYGR